MNAIPHRPSGSSARMAGQRSRVPEKLAHSASLRIAQSGLDALRKNNRGACRSDWPADEPARTIGRFNAHCASGADEQFHGESPVLGQAKTAPEGGRLSPIAKAPFVAIPFNRTITSTRGGPRTDADGRVLRPDGSRVEGLYCAGVAMANPIRTWAVGAGTTLGPNMTWGYICAKSIISRHE